MAHVSKDQHGNVIIRNDWHIEDIREMLNGDETLTDDECIKIMEDITGNFDANIGITWDVIEFHIDYFLKNRSKRNGTI